MISNVACVGCNIIGFILVLFSSIFYRHVTVTRGVAEAVMYIYWLLGNTLSISLAVGMAIVVNNKVRQCFVFPMMIIWRFTPVSQTRLDKWASLENMFQRALLPHSIYDTSIILMS